MTETSRERHDQRLVVVMFDGLGPDYLRKSRMPTLERWGRDRRVRVCQGGDADGYECEQRLDLLRRIS